MYAATNSLRASSVSDPGSYAMMPLGDLGSPTCTRAARDLVVAADGTNANASTEQREAYDRAASAVLGACSAN